MSIVSALPVESVRAHPHVSGASRRVKAAPTALTPIAGAMMCASGAFSTRAEAKPFRPARFVAALAFVLTAATLAIAGDPGPGRAPAQIALSDQMLSLGVAELDAAGFAELAPAAGPSQMLDAQDRFEIERMFRLSGAAR